MEKTNKELKKVLKQIFKKGFVLSKGHDNINSILELNTKKIRDDYFYKLNVLNLNHDKAENIKLYKSVFTDRIKFYTKKGFSIEEIKKFHGSINKPHEEQYLKELKEIKKEVDLYFKRSNKDILSLILNENSINTKIDRYTLNDKTFKEIKKEVDKQKLLIFSYSKYSYNIKDALINRLNQIITSFDIILNKKMSFFTHNLYKKLNDLPYKATREDIQALINDNQKLFKINIFLDKFKIKFLKEDDNLKVLKVYKNDYFKGFRKKFYIPFENHFKENGFCNSPIYILNDILYYEMNLNLKEGLKLKGIELKSKGGFIDAKNKGVFINYLEIDRLKLFGMKEYIKGIKENENLNKENKHIIINKLKEVKT